MTTTGVVLSVHVLDPGPTGTTGGVGETPAGGVGEPPDGGEPTGGKLAGGEAGSVSDGGMAGGISEGGAAFPGGVGLPPGGEATGVVGEAGGE